MTNSEHVTVRSEVEMKELMYNAIGSNEHLTVPI